MKTLKLKLFMAAAAVMVIVSFWGCEKEYLEDDIIIPDITYLDSTHLASTNGFVVANMFVSTNGHAYMKGFTSADNINFTQRSGVSVHRNGSGLIVAENSFVMPVKEGEYWKIFQAGTGKLYTDIHWSPINEKELDSRDSKDVNTNYRAPSDGFVVAKISARNSGTHAYMRGLTSADNINFTQRSGASVHHNGNELIVPENSFVMPVKEGEYWRIFQAGVGAMDIDVYWTPLKEQRLDLWNGKDVNKNYQAPSDGFVVANMFVSTNGHAYMRGLTSTDNTNFTQKTGASVHRNNDDLIVPENSFVMPVKEGEYWRIFQAGTGKLYIDVYWLPLKK